MIGDGTSNLGFLYTDRLVELVRSDATPAASSSTTTDAFALSQDLSRIMPPERHDAQRTLISAINSANTQKGLTNELLDYILTRAGVQAYRAEFEKIIMSKGNIFEKMFLQIKRQLSAIHAREALVEPAKRKSDAAMAREARDKALEVLAEECFNSLGAKDVYHAKDSKYYFAENDLSKSLSNAFLTRLYQNPDLATKMLDSQEEKTRGQAKAMEADIISMLPRSYYAEPAFAQKPDDQYFHDLSVVAQDFDLFLASPSVIDIANGSFEPSATASTPRASIIRRMQAGVHQRNPSLDDLTMRMEQLQLREQAKPALLEKLSAAELYLLRFLSKNGAHLQSTAKLNTVETVFLTCQKVREVALAIKKQKALEEPILKAKIEATNKAIKKQKEEVLKAYELKNPLVLTTAQSQPALDAKALKELNGTERQAYFAKVEQAYAQDATLIRLQKEKNEAAQKLASYDTLLAEVETNLAVYKQSFMKAYYPGVIPAAKALTQSYQAYMATQAQIEDFTKRGGTYSCLSFIPVRIAGKNGAPDRFECLVAMSGAEIDEASAVNAHRLLAEFAKSLPQFNGYTFRYVKASPAIDLVLKQLGKGLSGTAKPIAPYTRVDQDASDLSLVMPSYEKACAEKRLVSELINLYKEHGDDVQVLGCDNIALPKASDLTAARQAELNPPPKPVEESKAKSTQSKAPAKPAAPKISPMFKLAATVKDGGADRAVFLEGEHITCCSSCQAQKPAVFTALYDARQQHREKLRTAAVPAAGCGASANVKKADIQTQPIVVTMK